MGIAYKNIRLVTLVREINKRGFKKVLVVTDKTLLECGVSGKVTEVLDKAGIAYEVYSDIKPKKIFISPLYMCGGMNITRKIP